MASSRLLVTPFVGVWIETWHSFRSPEQSEVTPFVGVWIETILIGYFPDVRPVTPFVGVWIETIACSLAVPSSKSHPSWVCGLKHHIIVWLASNLCHTLRGCVD